MRSRSDTEALAVNRSLGIQGISMWQSAEIREYCIAPDGLRPDGSPIDSGVIPPMPLPRRMFAGQQTRFHRPIRIGDAVRRETELMDVALKTGSTGTLVFTTVVDRVFTPEGLALEE